MAMTRSWRLWGRALRVCVWMLLVSGTSHAGSQREEPLVDSVRTALSAAVKSSGPPTLVHADPKAAEVFQQWLRLAEARLAQQLKHRTSGNAPPPVAVAEGPLNSPPDVLAHELGNPHLRREFLQTVWYESQRAGLEPSLVLGLIQVESGFRKFAISSAGARGYMQVMPFWTRVLAEGDTRVLFQMQANLRFGCVILRHYLNVENGDLFLALGRYNGSRGQAQYPNAVLAAKKGWS